MMRVASFTNNYQYCFAGTRFRPLSFEVPKPLFPVAGVPMLQHHIEACAKVSYCIYSNCAVSNCRKQRLVTVEDKVDCLKITLEIH